MTIFRKDNIESIEQYFKHLILPSFIKIQPIVTGLDYEPNKRDIHTNRDIDRQTHTHIHRHRLRQTDSYTRTHTHTHTHR